MRLYLLWPRLCETTFHVGPWVQESSNDEKSQPAQDDDAEYD
jgi:hypothetical protein